MSKKKYLRKITIDRDSYGSVNLPKDVFDSFIARGCSHVELCWDDEENTILVRAF